MEHSQVAREPFRSGAIGSRNLGYRERNRIDMLPFPSFQDCMRDRMQSVRGIQHGLKVGTVELIDRGNARWPCSAALVGGLLGLSGNGVDYGVPLRASDHHGDDGKIGSAAKHEI